jgi:hypothetical protein
MNSQGGNYMNYDDFRKGCKGIADAIIIVAGAILGTLIYRFFFG